MIDIGTFDQPLCLPEPHRFGVGVRSEGAYKLRAYVDGLCVHLQRWPCAACSAMPNPEHGRYVVALGPDRPLMSKEP